MVGSDFGTDFLDYHDFCAVAVVDLMEDIKISHVPVMLNEVLATLKPKDGGIYFDGTFGGGGYSRAILNAAKCELIACDRDPFVKKFAEEFSKKYGENFKFSHSKFSEIDAIVEKLDGIVLDLGVSNFQLADSERGFSFRLNGPLDMEMGLCDETALDVIHRYSEKELADIIYNFGEEHFSRKIAKNIKLNLKNISTTEDLANVIRKCVRKSGKIDPSTKTFQALRIFVNDELGELRQVLEKSVNLLNPGGKIVVVSFHSLEDRIVKLFFKKISSGEEKKFALINKKPLIPSDNEIFLNPKARSAKLRAVYMI